jgi:hypothetical protein
MNNLVITIEEASEGGHFYTIYPNELDDLITPEPFELDQMALDGGLCTSDDIRDAVQMAADHARALVVGKTI